MRATHSGLEKGRLDHVSTDHVSTLVRTGTWTHGEAQKHKLRQPHSCHFTLALALALPARLYGDRYKQTISHLRHPRLEASLTAWSLVRSRPHYLTSTTSSSIPRVRSPGTPGAGILTHCNNMSLRWRLTRRRLFAFPPR